MVGKVFVVLLAITATIEAGGRCPDSNLRGNIGVPSMGEECQPIPGCNYLNNGSLTPIATQCSNVLPDEDCKQLFPCPDYPNDYAQCEPAGGDTDPTKKPMVRAAACTSPSMQEIALKCAKQCTMCCLLPESNCDNDIASPINCDQNKGKCKDPSWTSVMAQYCPQTCGLCANGTCRDLFSGCNTMAVLCKNVDWQGYMNTNCARTCKVCSTTTTTSSTSSCVDIASNCAPNANLCTNSVYRTLMLQQCCATCSRTSVSSVSVVSSSCSDSSTSCSTWLRNGFCSSIFYTTAQKRQYCARSCSLC